jgi:hypothetical protein
MAIPRQSCINHTYKNGSMEWCFLEVHVEGLYLGRSTGQEFTSVQFMKRSSSQMAYRDSVQSENVFVVNWLADNCCG